MKAMDRRQTAPLDQPTGALRTHRGGSVGIQTPGAAVEAALHPQTGRHGPATHGSLYESSATSASGSNRSSCAGAGFTLSSRATCRHRAGVSRPSPALRSAQLRACRSAPLTVARSASRPGAPPAAAARSSTAAAPGAPRCTCRQAAAPSTLSALSPTTLYSITPPGGTRRCHPPWTITPSTCYAQAGARRWKTPEAGERKGEMPRPGTWWHRWGRIPPVRALAQYAEGARISHQGRP